MKVVSNGGHRLVESWMWDRIVWRVCFPVCCQRLQVTGGYQWVANWHSSRSFRSLRKCDLQKPI